MVSRVVPDSWSSLAIHPGIGIARLGNSPTGWFLGPEVPGVVPGGDGAYKDAEGRVKRQAVRFRIFALDESGTVIEEVSLDHPLVAGIDWTVTLRNRKSEWWRFGGSKRVAALLDLDPKALLQVLGIDPGQLEIPEEELAPVGSDAELRERLEQIAGRLQASQPAVARTLRRLRRNASTQRRDGLMISPAPTLVSGRNIEMQSLSGLLEIENAAPQQVKLGDVATDERGRLLVLGGHGRSESVFDENSLSHYANNDGWFDDTSDGPIEAKVRLRDGRTLGVARGWVIAAPPHFSPSTPNIVTLYDVMLEAAEDLELPGRPALPSVVSFREHVFPILQRAARYAWVSRRAARGHGAGAGADFSNPEFVAALANPTLAATSTAPQKAILGRLRRPIRRTGAPPKERTLSENSQDALNEANLDFMPQLAGDEGDTSTGDPTTWASLTPLQYARLERWAQGDFVDDRASGPAPARELEQLPIAEQPAALDRAVLEACQGGAFFPGLEATSVVRFRSFYSRAFRVSNEMQPGDITRWMAVPWQADFFECRDHWWPTIRPDDVVTEEAFGVVEARLGNGSPDDTEAFLRTRQPWARGIDMGIPDRPGLPLPQTGEALAAYRQRVSDRRDGYVSRYLAMLNEQAPSDGQSFAGYRRAILELLERSLFTPGAAPPAPELPEPKRGEAPADYHLRLVRLVRDFILENTGLPEAAAEDSAASYAARIDASNVAWRALFDTEWRSRVLNNGKNRLVENWWRLGFVRPKQLGARTVLVETERRPHDLLPFRECFYRLMNLETFPSFLDKARELAEEYLSRARALGEVLSQIASERHYAFFEYEPTAFQNWLRRIYDTEQARAAAYDPASGQGERVFRTPEQVRERIRQLAPFNQLDGSWLERIVKAGPISHIGSYLFEIWSDEVGNGDPAKNHANVYTNLLRSAGIYLPELDSRAYADHPDLWDGSFSSPSYQTAIAQFPESFLPELLGMTLYLEWEAIYLPAMVKLYDYHGYDSLFYRLHVAIDNAAEGHGARARDAVQRYLELVEREGGPTAVQNHWRRIWTGYLAYRYIGDSEWEFRLANPPTAVDKLVALIEQKREYAQRNHGKRRFGAAQINSWFAEPYEWLQVLADSDLIVPGDSRRSRLFDLMAPTGVMYKVFTPVEREIWASWIDSLTPRAPTPPEPRAAMLTLVQEFSARGMGVAEHGKYELTGRYIDPESNQPTQIRRPVSWWFQLGQPEALLDALADPSNELVVPGEPEASRLVTEFLSGNRRMARRLQDANPDLGFDSFGERSARLVIVEWIRSLPPVPVQRVRPPAASLHATRSLAHGEESTQLEDYLPELATRTLAGRLSVPPAAGGQRLGPGGGAPH